MITQTFKVIFKEPVEGMSYDNWKLQITASCFGFTASPVNEYMILLEVDRQLLEDIPELQERDSYHLMVGFLQEFLNGDVENVGFIQEIRDYEMNWDHIKDET